SPSVLRRKPGPGGRAPPRLGAYLVHDQCVPPIAHGGKNAKGAGHYLFCELRQAAGSVHVFVDAGEVRRRAVELHVSRQVASHRFEVVIGPRLGGGGATRDGGSTLLSF